MAEVAEGASFTDPATAISQGRRHLLVRDYSSAVSALSQACDLLARKHGDTSDELGEPYLLYGRALLGLAREEAGVLGGGLPGTSEDKEDADEDADEEEEDRDDAGEEAEEPDGEDQEEDEVAQEEPQEAHSRQPGNVDSQEERGERSKTDVKDEAGSSSSNSNSNSNSKNKTDDSKIAEQKTRAKEIANGETAPCSSSSETTSVPTTSHNGHGKENSEDDSEDLAKEDEDDGVNNLQVAWEVLELAKLVLLKRGPPGWKLLAESYRLLGEVAMEGGNHQGALTDLQGCLNLLEKIEPREPRAIAEIYYQLGLAHSLGNDFDASIEQFNQATSLLETRIKELEETKVPSKSDDPFYTVEGEIQELKDLLPEIQEKITDMRDFKQEACKLVIEGIKNKVANGDGGANASASASAGVGPSGQNESPKVQKPVSDISHLVRKKRKADEPEPDAPSPLKKPTPEKAV